MWATDREMQNEKSETDYKVGPRKSQKVWTKNSQCGN